MKTRVVQTTPVRSVHSVPSRDDIITTSGLSKRYGEHAVLDALDLAVPRQSIVGFLGPNGAGKTTTIRLLLGLTRPTSGAASVFGNDSVRDSLAIRKRIGYLAQDPRFYPHLSARETLEFTARFFYSGPTGRIRARIAETLELVGLEKKADRPVRGFSGGERQRLGIAQAQINHPDLLILDEPAASLDPVGRRDVLEIMERLRSNTTIFYSTHLLDDVQRVSDRVAILNQGRLVANAPTAELLDGGAGWYELVVRGDGAATIRTLRAADWVTDVRAASKDGLTAVSVSVTDPETAEARLLRSVLADDGVIVTAFDRKHFSLEDVFLQLVEGDQR
jgi:ABC-2 type transport system ATP-binding protein